MNYRKIYENYYDTIRKFVIIEVSNVRVFIADGSLKFDRNLLEKSITHLAGFSDPEELYKALQKNLEELLFFNSYLNTLGPGVYSFSILMSTEGEYLIRHIKVTNFIKQ